MFCLLDLKNVANGVSSTVQAAEIVNMFFPLPSLQEDK